MADRRNVLICSSVVPFVYGGAELHVDGLRKAALAAGYNTDVVSIPYQWDPPQRIVKSCLVWRLLELEGGPAAEADLLIATKFPTYAARHSNKVAWVFHQHRSLYDLKGTIYDDFAGLEGAEEYRELISEMDTGFLAECREVFATSCNVAARLREHSGFDAEVLYHPPPFDGRYISEEYGDDILLVGRLEPLKRVDLVIKAMKHVRRPGAVLRVAGRGFLEEPLRELAEAEGVADRVRFDGYVPDEELLHMYAHAGVVVYVPYDEDYGYATLEGFKSRRPVVVTDDSGGPLEFVRDGETGRVVSARPAEVAGAIDEMLIDRKKARRFGDAGFESVEGIGWDSVVDTLIRPFLP